MTPSLRGSVWTKITPQTGSSFHEKSQPKTGLVGFFVRECLQEVGPEWWIVTDDSVWIRADFSGGASDSDGVAAHCNLLLPVGSRPRKGPATGASLGVVPEDDLLVFLATRGGSEIAEDDADLRGFQLDREVFLPRTLGNAVPAGSDLEARALVDAS